MGKPPFLTVYPEWNKKGSLFAGKTPAATCHRGNSAKEFGKKRGRKEDLGYERTRLTASATFLLIRYRFVLNIA